jgi:hypothetical protein
MSFLVIETSAGDEYHRDVFPMGGGEGVGKAKMAVLALIDKLAKRKGCVGFTVSKHDHDCDHER